MGRKQNQQRRNAHWGKDWEKLAASFESLLPVESHRMHLICLVMTCDNTCEIVFIGEAPLSPGSQSCRHSLSSMYQNSRPPEGRQAFSVNYIVCTKNFGTVSPSCQFWAWWDSFLNPSFQKPGKIYPWESSQVSCAHIFLQGASDPCVFFIPALMATESQ